MPASRAVKSAGSRRSAATGRRPAMSPRELRANPYVVHPWVISSRARLLPMIPLAPTTKAVAGMVFTPHFAEGDEPLLRRVGQGGSRTTPAFRDEARLGTGS